MKQLHIPTVKGTSGQSRRFATLARAPTFIIFSTLLSSCAVLILSLVPLILLWNIDGSPVRPDVRVRNIRSAADSSYKNLQYVCTEPIVPVKSVVPRNALNNGIMYDLRPIKRKLIERVDDSGPSHLVLRFSTARNGMLEKMESSANLTLDMMRSDWTAAFDVDLSALLQNSKREENHGKYAFVTIPWTMNLYDADSTPLWMALYGLKDAGYQVDVQPAYEDSRKTSRTTSCITGVARSLNEGRVLMIGKDHFAEPRRKPYYRVAKSAFHSPRVTICTQLTVNRLVRLDAMAQNWGGPISAVLFIGYGGNVEEEIAELDEYWSESVALQAYVDLHLVIDGKRPWFRWENMKKDPYPVNLLRQLAVDYANRTDYILYAEGDMVSMHRGHDIIASTWDDLLNVDNLRIKEVGSPAAFALPIYYLEDCPENDIDCDKMSTHDAHAVAHDFAERVPISKAALIQSVVSNRKKYGLKRMSLRYPNQLEFDFDGWEKVEKGSSLFLPYDGKESALKYVPPDPGKGKKMELKNYRRRMSAHEPYVVVRKEGLPPYDVLYWSQEGDKRSQINDMIVKGYKLFIHRDGFLVNYDDRNVDYIRGGERKNDGWDWIAGYNKSWRRHFIRFVHKLMTGNDGV